MAKIVKKNRVTVYALSSSATRNSVRYIGQTASELAQRLSRHLSASLAGTTPVAFWIRQESEKGRTILIQSLEINSALHSESKWIALFSGSGAKLLNCNAGRSGKVVGIRGKKIVAASKAVFAPAAMWPFPTSSRP
jgi:hypothetical protein